MNKLCDFRNPHPPHQWGFDQAGQIISYDCPGIDGGTVSQQEMPLVEGGVVCSECNQISGKPHYRACTVGLRVKRDQEAAKIEAAVKHPQHYGQHPSGVECIDIIQWMTFNVGTAMKYLWRAGLKDGNPTVQDLRKAIEYIDFEIARLEKMKKDGSGT